MINELTESNALAGQPILSEPMTGSTLRCPNRRTVGLEQQKETPMAIYLKRGRRSKKGRKHGRKSKRHM